MYNQVLKTIKSNNTYTLLFANCKKINLFNV